MLRFGSPASFPGSGRWLRLHRSSDLVHFTFHMADIEITRSHSLGTSGARTAVEKVADKLHEKLNVETNWAGDVLHFEGNGADGRIEVRESEVHLALELNLLLKSMKGWIEQEAQNYLDKYLQPKS